MTPSQELFAVAIALYLIECIAAVPRRAIVFRSLWRHRTRAKDVTAYPGSDTKALVLKMPLPPLGTFYETQFCPISLSPAGICNQPAHYLHTSPTGAWDEGLILFENIGHVEARGRMLWVNGCGIADCGTDAAADQLTRFILRLRNLSPPKRHRRIEAAIRRSLDTDRVARAYKKSLDVTSSLRTSCNFLCVYLFVLCPLIVWLRGLSAVWWVLLAAMVPFCLVAVFDFVQAHRRLFPKRTTNRRQQAALFGLMPLALIRARDMLTRHALVGYHPLAVSAALGEAGAYKKLAKPVWADLVFPISGGNDTKSVPMEQTKQWMRERIREAVERNLRSAGLEPDDLLAPPVVDDASALSYCPRCTMQFETPGGTCPYCPGVTLKEMGVAEDGAAKLSDSNAEIDGCLSASEAVPLSSRDRS